MATTTAAPPAPDDLWKHRSRFMRCQTCMFFVEKAPVVEPVSAAITLGRCRRHAPTLAGWPVVWQFDWCGDHKLDEEKL